MQVLRLLETFEMDLVQLRERSQHEIRLMRHQHGIPIKKLNRDMGKYIRLSPDIQDGALRRQA